MENFNSKILLQHAIKILKETPIKEHDWAIGGGTVLAYFYHHRLSKDIDIFIQDLQLAKISIYEFPMLKSRRCVKLKISSITR